ncbi:MAG: hypothetical protein ACLSGQ_00940 [Parabacteroides distasonis]
MNLIFASIAIFLLYIGSMVFMFGVPWSISNTYYLLEEKRKGLGWLFTVFCYGVDGFLLPGWLNVTPEGYQFTCFLSAAGLAFVGTAAQFKERLTNTVHYTAAIICCLFSQIWCFAAGFWWLSLLSFAFFYVLPDLAGKRTGCFGLK